MRFAWVGGLQYREVHPRCPPAHLCDAPAGAGPEVILSRMIFHCILINRYAFQLKVIFRPNANRGGTVTKLHCRVKPHPQAALSRPPLHTGSLSGSTFASFRHSHHQSLTVKDAMFQPSPRIHQTFTAVGQNGGTEAFYKECRPSRRLPLHMEFIKTSFRMQDNPLRIQTLHIVEYLRT